MSQLSAPGPPEPWLYVLPYSPEWTGQDMSCEDVCVWPKVCPLSSPNLAAPAMFSHWPWAAETREGVNLAPHSSPVCPVLNSPQILMPELASLRVAVMEEGSKFLGHRIIPINALNSGKGRGTFFTVPYRSETKASSRSLSRGWAASGRWP